MGYEAWGKRSCGQPNQALQLTTAVMFVSGITQLAGANLAFPYPRHLKYSSPRMSVPDNEMIAGIFSGEVIIVEAGKLSFI